MTRATLTLHHPDGSVVTCGGKLREGKLNVSMDNPLAPLATWDSPYGSVLGLLRPMAQTVVFEGTWSDAQIVAGREDGWIPGRFRKGRGRKAST